MIQFNLLPDIKLEYIKARRMKRLVVTGSLIIGSLALAMFALLFLVVNVMQTRHMSNLDRDIASGIAEIKAIPDIDKVLTIQNQLRNLTPLHEKKPAASRLIEYLGLVTPDEATISQTSTDFTLSTIKVDGAAKNLAVVNKYADTLKFTTFTTNDNNVPQPAFSEVVLNGFGVGEAEATYQISFKFNPEIFNNTQDVKLSVPNIISTRSQTEKPSDLFKESRGGSSSQPSSSTDTTTPTTEGIQ